MQANGVSAGRPPFDYSCDEKNIVATYDYSGADGVSFEARDLIGHLLVKDVGRRWTAAQVLEHAWFN
jgi:hypothetical protein